MKIVRHGNPQAMREVEMISKCDKCGCVFTFTKKEARPFSNNGGGTVYYTECPECDHACCFDTGYPGRDENSIASNRRVKADHAMLWSLVQE